MKNNGTSQYPQNITPFNFITYKGAGQIYLLLLPSFLKKICGRTRFGTSTFILFTRQKTAPAITHHTSLVLKRLSWLPE